jgi:hypothetical protein
VQIAGNPSGREIVIDSQSHLIDQARGKNTGIRVQTYSVVLARNGYAKKP